MPALKSVGARRVKANVIIYVGMGFHPHWNNGH
jgi:hypothetical protein